MHQRILEAGWSTHRVILKQLRPLGAQEGSHVERGSGGWRKLSGWKGRDRRAGRGRGRGREREPGPGMQARERRRALMQASLTEWSCLALPYRCTANYKALTQVLCTWLYSVCTRLRTMRTQERQMGSVSSEYSSASRERRLSYQLSRKFYFIPP